jgi:hypothetical protein
MSSDNSAAQQIHPCETRWMGAKGRFWEFLLSPLGYLPRGLTVLVCGMCLTCDPNCDLSNQDQAFKVTLVKRMSDYWCDPKPDPDPLIGQSFTILINDRAEGRGGDCGCGAGPILESPTTVTWSNAVPQKNDCQGPMYSVTMNVAKGDCTAESLLSLYTTGPTSSSDPNNTFANLDYGWSACNCGGSYSVTVERVALPE